MNIAFQIISFNPCIPYRTF